MFSGKARVRSSDGPEFDPRSIKLIFGPPPKADPAKNRWVLQQIESAGAAYKTKMSVKQSIGIRSRSATGSSQEKTREYRN